MSVKTSKPLPAQALQAIRAFQQKTPNFQMAINSNAQDLVAQNYIGPAYANGVAFPAYRQPADYNTDWFGTSTWNSVNALQQNLPTDNTASRNGTQQNALGSGNQALKGWVFATQTLTNPSSSTYSCTNNTDCAALGSTYTCNSNYSPWNDSYGNQSGGTCVPFVTPELSGGSYTRTVMNGGIGSKCQQDGDCDTNNGYECNNTTDPFGKNIQQTGYCAMPYMCGSEKRYLGTPYNSGIPIPPDPSQNNNGQGYTSLVDCMNVATAQQKCIQGDSGSYFAVFPGFCPIQPNQRQGNPQGALPTSNTATQAFQIPAYGDSMASSLGSTHAQQALSLTGYQQTQKEFSPLQYQINSNPNAYTATGQNTLAPSSSVAGTGIAP